MIDPACTSSARGNDQWVQNDRKGGPHGAKNGLRSIPRLNPAMNLAPNCDHFVMRRSGRVLCGDYLC